MDIPKPPVMLRKSIRVTVVAADGLSKCNLFRLPDPFAVITAGDQTNTTRVIETTVNPYWNETFHITAKAPLVSVQIFDQRNSRRKDQGFLGVVHVWVRDLLNSEPGCHEILALDLKDSNGSAAHGKLIMVLSTNTQQHISNTEPSQVARLTTALSELGPNGDSSSASSANLNLRVSSVSILSKTSSNAIADGPGPSSLTIPSGTLLTTTEDQPYPPRPTSVKLNSGSSLGGTTTTSTVPSAPFTAHTRAAAHTANPTVDQRGHFPSGINLLGSTSSIDDTRSTWNGPVTVDHSMRDNERNTTRDHCIPAEITNAIHRRGPQANPTDVTTGTTTTVSDPLPAGWEERYNPEGCPYYVDHNRQITTWAHPLLQFDPLPPGWETRVTSTNRVYFVDHNTQTSTWANPLPSIQYKGDFTSKLIYFRIQPAMRPEPGSFMRLLKPGNCMVKIRDNHILEDSYAGIMRQTPNDLKKLMIIFYDEQGRGRTDISNEFFSLLSHEVFNPSNDFFENSAHNSYTLQINPANVNLSYFKFIDAYFVVSFYKMILNKKATLADLGSVDAELHQSLTCMLENDITDVIEETFTTTEQRFGKVVTIELKPGGSGIPVAEENKQEYVDLIVEYRIFKRVKDQSDALMSGLSELIPQGLFMVFDERELELVIGGMPKIDVTDWSNFTDYKGYKINDKVVKWFWKCVRSWPPERKSRLLQFATGTSRIPRTGFRDLQGSDGPRRFTIEKSGDPSQLPMSHMCFNKLDLPPYKDYASLEQKLTIAVEETIGLQK